MHEAAIHWFGSVLFPIKKLKRRERIFEFPIIMVSITKVNKVLYRWSSYYLKFCKLSKFSIARPPVADVKVNVEVDSPDMISAVTHDSATFFPTQFTPLKRVNKLKE